MKRFFSIFLPVLLLVCTVNCGYAAYPIKAVGHTAFVADSGLNGNKPQVAKADNSEVHHHLRPADDGRNGRRALIWAILGLLFQPFGILAIYFGVKGWKKQQRNRALAIVGFTVGVIETLLVILITLAILL